MLDPIYARAYSTRSSAHLELGDPGKALIDADAAIAREPAFAAAYSFAEALTSWSHADLDATIAYVRRAIASFEVVVDPSTIAAHHTSIAAGPHARMPTSGEPRRCLAPRAPARSPAGVVVPGHRAHRLGAVVQGQADLTAARASTQDDDSGSSSMRSWPRLRRADRCGRVAATGHAPRVRVVAFMVTSATAPDRNRLQRGTPLRTTAGAWHHRRDGWSRPTPDIRGVAGRRTHPTLAAWISTSPASPATASSRPVRPWLEAADRPAQHGSRPSPWRTSSSTASMVRR